MAEAPPPDVQVFMVDGTWTKPSAPEGYAPYTEVAIVCIGGGGGGGSGSTQTAQTQGAGGGGAGGCRGEASLGIGEAGATETIIVGKSAKGGPSSEEDGEKGATAKFGSAVSAAGGNPGKGGKGTAHGAGGTGAEGGASGGDGGALNYEFSGAPGGDAIEGGGAGGGGGGANVYEGQHGGTGGKGASGTAASYGNGHYSYGDAGAAATDEGTSEPFEGGGGGGGGGAYNGGGAGTGGLGATNGGGGGGGGAGAGGSSVGGAGGKGIVLVVTTGEATKEEPKTLQLKVIMTVTMSWTAPLKYWKMLKAIQTMTVSWFAKINLWKIFHAKHVMTLSWVAPLKTSFTIKMEAIMTMTMSWVAPLKYWKMLKSVQTMTVSWFATLSRVAVLKSVQTMTVSWFALIFKATQSRVAVGQSFEQSRVSIIIRDPVSGTALARWANDELNPDNVISGVELSGAIPGGKKELRGTLPRNPRQDWPDLRGFLDVECLLPGRTRIWHGRIGKAPRTDGDNWIIDGECVGHAAALEDRKALRLGFIDSGLSRWGDMSTRRRAALGNATSSVAGPNRITVETEVGGGDDKGEYSPGLVFRMGQVTANSTPINEVWYNGGGVDLGALMFDGKQLTEWAKDPNMGLYGVLSLDDNTSTFESSASMEQESKTQQLVSVAAAGFKRAFFQMIYKAVLATGDYTNTYSFLNIRVISRLAQQGLALQGTWPNVGYTAAQMLRLAIPTYSYLKATEASVEDDGFVIQDAWFDNPDALSGAVSDLTKLGLYDWFVKDNKLFELRAPGTYGRKWQAYQSKSNYQEAGEDTDRLWDRIVVGYQDLDGTTKYVGYPGSGCEFEATGLQVIDPSHPAVRANIPREDLLILEGVSTAATAVAVGERWLREANELSRSGTAELVGMVQDTSGNWYPVDVVAEGDLIRFPDARDKSYRKVVEYNNQTEEHKVTITLDAPSESVQALLERLQAVLVPLGVG